MRNMMKHPYLLPWFLVMETQNQISQDVPKQFSLQNMVQHYINLDVN